MSKAFTRDEGSSAPEVIRRGSPALAPGEKRYITPQGYAAMLAELERLTALRTRLRHPEGGLEAAQRVGDVEAQISLLQATVKAVTVVVPEPQQAGRVFFGARVELEDEDGGRSAYRLVGPDELDPRNGKISAGSPLGKALLGRAVGDTVALPGPREPREVTVVSISYGDQDRG